MLRRTEAAMKRIGRVTVAFQLAARSWVAADILPVAADSPHRPGAEIPQVTITTLDTVGGPSSIFPGGCHA